MLRYFAAKVDPGGVGGVAVTSAEGASAAWFEGILQSCKKQGFAEKMQIYVIVVLQGVTAER